MFNAGLGVAIPCMEMMTIGEYTVIADTGSTLLKILRENLTPEPVLKPEMIGICSPAEKADLRLALYLYSVEETGASRNVEMRQVGQGRLQYPPLMISLNYLLTAHSTAELNFRALDEHRILGRLMQVMYDNAIVRGSVLHGTLAENNEEMRITLNNISMEEMNKIWNFPNVPYKLSLAYRVGPLSVESKRVKDTRRVLQADIDIHG